MNAQARWAFHVERSQRWLWLESLDQKCLRTCAFVCVCLLQSHWFIGVIGLCICLMRFSLGRIWFAIPVTATQRVLTDGIYMCSMSKCLELDPLLWSWKAPSKTWNILVRSREIYLWACLRIKRQGMRDLNESALDISIHCLLKCSVKDKGQDGWRFHYTCRCTSCQYVQSSVAHNCCLIVF